MTEGVCMTGTQNTESQNNWNILTLVALPDVATRVPAEKKDEKNSDHSKLKLYVPFMQTPFCIHIVDFNIVVNETTEQLLMAETLQN